MAYFSNGTEGEMFQEKYCANCIHGGGDCAVMDAQMLYNGDDEKRGRVSMAYH